MMNLGQQAVRRPPQAVNGRPGARPTGNPQPADRVPGVDLEALCESAKDSRKSLEAFRRHKHDFVKQFAGSNWSDKAATAPVFINFIALYVQIMSRSLVAKNPTVMLSTFEQEFKSVIAKAEGWIKEELEDMDFSGTMREVVTDALFSIGVLKVGVATPVDATLSGWDLPAGQPFCMKVSLDDFVVDMMATSFHSVSYIGHRYRLPVDAAKAMFRQRKLEADDGVDDYNEEGDEKIAAMGRTTGSDREFEKSIDVWEFYLPRHKLVVTLADNGGSPDPKKVLKVQKWIGPPTGPYHILGYGIVPDNLMPKSPVMDLIDLHLAGNRTLRKVVRETDNYKKVLPVRGGAMDDAGRLKQAMDGEMIQADNASDMKEVEFGGPSAVLILMVEKFKELFDFVGGNLSILGGRAAASRTATQDKLLNENASAGVMDLQETTIAFIVKVMRSLLWYWWNHPQKTMKSEYSPKSLPDFKKTRTLSPQERQGGEMPRVKIDPYSISHSTPQARLAFLQQVVASVQPFMQLLQQQGVMFDVNAYLTRVSRYGDEPDLGEIFQFQEPPAPPQPASGGDRLAGGGNPNKPNGEYTRTSVGQGSQAAQGQSNTAQLMKMASAGPQQGAS